MEIYPKDLTAMAQKIPSIMGIVSKYIGVE